MNKLDTKRLNKWIFFLFLMGLEILFDLEKVMKKTAPYMPIFIFGFNVLLNQGTMNIILFIFSIILGAFFIYSKDNFYSDIKINKKFDEEVIDSTLEKLGKFDEEVIDSTLEKLGNSTTKEVLFNMISIWALILMIILSFSVSLTNFLIYQKINFYYALVWIIFVVLTAMPLIISILTLTPKFRLIVRKVLKYLRG